MAGTVVIHGDDELRRKLDPAVLAGGPATAFLSKWSLFTEGAGKDRAPVWRGHLRRSITHEIDSRALPRYARVGTNLEYGPAMEYGTGLLSDAPDSGHKRHFPPPQALDAWAIDHGFRVGSKKAAKADAAASPGSYGLMVSQIIYRRGGLKPRRYLRDAFDESQGKIDGWLTEMARDIETGASDGAV